MKLLYVISSIQIVIDIHFPVAIQSVFFPRPKLEALVIRCLEALLEFIELFAWLPCSPRICMK